MKTSSTAAYLPARRRAVRVARADEGGAGGVEYAKEAGQRRQREGWERR
jgi:hypothetical protein